MWDAPTVNRRRDGIVYVTTWLVLATKRFSGVPQKMNKLKIEENTKPVCTYLQP
jgi:hypothetical protein